MDCGEGFASLSMLKSHFLLHKLTQAKKCEIDVTPLNKLQDANLQSEEPAKTWTAPDGLVTTITIPGTNKRIVIQQTGSGKF